MATSHTVDHNGIAQHKDRSSSSVIPLDTNAPNSKGDAHSSSNSEGHHRRAAQACSRCRKQKLRCLGGLPCARCVKADKECDFGRPGNHPSSHASNSGIGKGDEGGDAGVVKARLENLESSIANILAGLTEPDGSGNTNSLRAPMSAPIAIPTLPSAPLAPPVPPARAMESAPPSWPWDCEPTSFRTDAVPLAPQPMVTVAQDIPQVGFRASPSTSFISPYSPFSLPEATSPSRGLRDVGDGQQKRKVVGPEERLASVSNGFEPPFKALVYQPSIWENREPSRRNSPQPSGQSVYPLYNPLTTRDDPVALGLIDGPTAKVLFTFYVNNCHPFLPVVDTAQSEPFTSIQRHTTLFCAILAIAARFHPHHAATSIMLGPHIPKSLAELAESHLAQTLLRKYHTLADVQAILLLAAWGLQSSGKGPDAWILTGHAVRIARRLGIHRMANSTGVMNQKEAGAAPVSVMDAAARQKWKTWLSCFSFDSFLSLGFGRPQCSQFESVDDQAFLESWLSKPLPRPGTQASLSLYGAAYTAATAQLAHIARSLVAWTEDQASASGTDRESLLKMLADLNGRLDGWCKLWIWSGSSHTLYLGASARIARLQAEHLRLSINSMALRSLTDDTEREGGIACLRKALNAATTTIQTHFESSQTDLALSFATDYITITLAQAAVFLIRLAKVSPSVQQEISLDLTVVSHYLTMSVDVLDLGDKSETRLSSHLARTICAISRAAGLPINSDESTSLTIVAAESQYQVDSSEQVMPPPNTDRPVSAGPFDLYTLWAEDDQFDLSYFLGLSDHVTQDGDRLDNVSSNWDL